MVLYPSWTYSLIQFKFLSCCISTRMIFWLSGKHESCGYAIWWAQKFYPYIKSVLSLLDFLVLGSGIVWSKHGSAGNWVSLIQGLWGNIYISSFSISNEQMHSSPVRLFQFLPKDPFLDFKYPMCTVTFYPYSFPHKVFMNKWQQYAVFFFMVTDTFCDESKDKTISSINGYD